MGVFDEVNRLSAAGMSEFRIQSFDGWRLLIIGSFNLCYYHDVEVAFGDVAHINCPTEFAWPTFSDAGPSPLGELRRFAIQADDGKWEVVAGAVEVAIRRVYHDDRAQVLPDDR